MVKTCTNHGYEGNICRKTPTLTVKNMVSVEDFLFKQSLDPGLAHPEVDFAAAKWRAECGAATGGAAGGMLKR